MKKVIAIIILLALCVGLMTSCTQSDNQTQAAQGNNNGESNSETLDITGDNVFLNPDGEEFARGFSDYFGGIDEPGNQGIIQYWDTGKQKIKFETVADETKGWYVLKINDNITDFDFLWFLNIIVSDEFIVIVTGGTDIRSNPIYVFDYNGNTLFKAYYLNNKGMVIAPGASVSVDGNKIIMRGTRFTHGINLVMNSAFNESSAFLEYKDYIYEDIIYDYSDYELKYRDEVYLDNSNAEEVKMLNKDEIVEADFVLEYLGGGKFGKIVMTDSKTTLEEYLKEYGEQIGCVIEW